MPLSNLRPALLAGLFALCLVLPLDSTRGDAAPLSPVVTPIDIGRAIYEQGILPDGTQLRGTQATGATLEGPQAACAACHRRSGFGGYEGSILIPPISGLVLSNPGPHFIAAGSTPTGAAASVPWYRAMTRSSYDDTSLARALREGLDPDGDPLMPPMPRYELDGPALADLLAYVKQLSAAPSPGLAPDTLHLATVITPDARPAAQKAVLGVLRAWVAQQPTELHWRLEEWRLSGPPETWEAQLEARYREQPVFALLSGVGGAEWLPIHRFCERAEVACVLPSIDLLPDQTGQGGDYYSLYFSPGLGLEAELLAAYLQSIGVENGRQPRIVQIYGDASAKRAVDALQRSTAGFAGEVSPRAFHRIAPTKALAGVSPSDTLILWLRPSDLMALVAKTPEGPPAGRVFLSAMLAPPDTVSLPPTWKARVIYVSLFDDWSPQNAYARTWLKGWLRRAGVPSTGNLRLQADAYGACYYFTRAFADMQKGRYLWRGEQLTRAYLLERLESAVAKNTGNPIDLGAWAPFYRRLSLAAGQRIAAKGGELLRYASPESETLIPVEEARTNP